MLLYTQLQVGQDALLHNQGTGTQEGRGLASREKS